MVTPGIVAAREARRQSTDALMAVIQQGPGVRDLVHRVHEHERRNHLVELLDVTLGKAKP